MHLTYFLCPAAADLRLAQRVDETDDDREVDANLTDQWILTKNATMLIKALSLTWTWRKTKRFYHFGALPQQSESGGIVQPHDRFQLDGGRPGVVTVVCGELCALSTLFQLHLVSDRPQNVYAQRFAQGGVSDVFQHV